jgi:hypothetical protein
VGSLRRSVSRGSSDRKSHGPCIRHASLRPHPMPSRTIEQSHRPRVSDRTMHCHSSSGQSSGLLFQKNDWRRHNSEMEPPQGRIDSPLYMRNLRPGEDHSRSGRSIGWAECREKKIGIEPTGSCFLLTFPLIGPFRLMRVTWSCRELCCWISLSAAANSR